MKTRSLLILIALFSFQLSFAQELEAAKEILQKIEARYMESDGYYLELTYDYYDANNPEVALESLQGEVLKKNKNYYSRIDKTETIFIDDHFLKINHDEKAVLYSVFKQGQAPTPIQISGAIDYFSGVEVTQEQDLLSFDFRFKDIPGAAYHRMIVTVDMVKKSLLKQQLFLKAGLQYPGQTLSRQHTKDAIIVTTFNERPINSFKRNPFDLTKYIQDGTEVSLAKKLAAYELYHSK